MKISLMISQGRLAGISVDVERVMNSELREIVIVGYWFVVIICLQDGADEGIYTDKGRELMARFTVINGGYLNRL